MDLTMVVLILHVMGAIVIFGPTFAFPFISAMSAKEPAHGNFGLRVVHAVASKWVGRGSAIQLATGVALIFLADWDLLASEWLLIGIVLYLSDAFVAIVIQDRNIARMIELTSAPPGPEGPSPEIPRMAKKLQLGGTYLTVVLIIITILMVWKPGAARV